MYIGQGRTGQDRTGQTGQGMAVSGPLLVRKVDRYVIDIRRSNISFFSLSIRIQDGITSFLALFAFLTFLFRFVLFLFCFLFNSI